MTDQVRNRIKEIRQSKGLAQIELAKKVGITVAHLNKLENHTHDKYLTVVMAIRIAAVLEVPWKTLFLDENWSK
ncbi:helix-turn-helix transcriptional regulator [Cytobacillus sp. FSL R5-0596]|uniref:helix-turn-helix transcriptional regulator n=1 Tax=Cytobacillus sp. FSL R5-0596 TaxID=2954696 RepID=UPI0030F996C8